MTSPILHGVYVAAFPFVEGSGDKLRPVVVASRPAGPFGVLSVVPLSSSSDSVGGDFALRDWDQVGLRRPSLARIHRVTGLLQSDLRAYLGTLSDGDEARLRVALAGHFLLG
ncbi:type II toxin-antitoxin system PemK/MazF family toxin [Microbacterium sp.]|uniref:type II toxin-antitoxin system PemK/MazF family toxin n=1 Tax=Microbacterium sp. TaxID=51671 RepID=UPI003C71B3EE